MKPVEDRRFKQALAAAEPVVVEAEAVDAVLFCQLNLAVHDFRGTQVIEADVDGELGLVVPKELGDSLCDICPLREALAMPLVVLLELVELRQIEGHDFRRLWLALEGIVCQWHEIRLLRLL